MAVPPSKVIIPESQIRLSVEKVSRSVGGWLQETKKPALNLVSVLEGARPFTRDLVECLSKSSPQIRLQLHEIRCKATDGENLLGNREWSEIKFNLEDIRRYPVLIVDDLVDSGLTLKTLKEDLAGKGAPEVKTAVFLNKFMDCRVPVDFCGIHLDWDRKRLAAEGLRDRWLFGYGMDYLGQYRDLGRVEAVDISLEV